MDQSNSLCSQPGLFCQHSFLLESFGLIAHTLLSGFQYSPQKEGEKYDLVEILERTEYNLGVQLTSKIFKAMFCCSSLQLQDSARPRQRLSEVVFRVLVSKCTSTSRSIFSSVFCLLLSMCAETCLKAAPAYIPFLLFHPIKCIPSLNVPWWHDSKPWYMWILLGSLHMFLAMICNP